jgi:hypothetical protein
MRHERTPNWPGRLVALLASGTIAAGLGSSVANSAPGVRHSHRVARPGVASGYQQPAMAPMCGAAMQMAALRA